MNLHAVAGPIVASVNPWIAVSIKRSTGSTTQANGKRVSTYADPVSARAQMQPLQFTDLQQVAGINITGERQIFIVDGVLSAVSRVDGGGGDLISCPDGSVWLVVMLSEGWSRTAGWTRAIATRQTT